MVLSEAFDVEFQVTVISELKGLEMSFESSRTHEKVHLSEPSRSKTSNESAGGDRMNPSAANATDTKSNNIISKFFKIPRRCPTKGDTFRDSCCAGER